MSKQDLSFNALVEVTGATIASERGALNASLSQIRAAADQLSDEELASEIRYRSTVYRKTFPGMALTPTALAKHWERIPLEAPKATYPEPSPAGECSTCGGDKLVVYFDAPCRYGRGARNHPRLRGVRPLSGLQLWRKRRLLAGGRLTVRPARSRQRAEEDRGMSRTSDSMSDMVIDHCPFCDQSVYGDQPYLHEITGWEKTRSEGGANAIRLRLRTGKKAHALCVDKAGKGLQGQQGLWRE